jgi:predicted nucleic acid-binding protein
MILVGPTVLYDLGMVGELDLLGAFDAELVVPEAAVAEVDVEPAETNVERFLDEGAVSTAADTGDFEDDARTLLGVEGLTADAVLVAAVLAARDRGEDVALVSDDRRLRAVADGLGATVTGTFGTVARAASEDKYFSTAEAKRVVRRTDSQGLQMTGQLREQAVGEVE